MGSGRRVGQRPDCHTFLCKFWHFQMALSQWKPAWLTPNLGILWISVSSFWLCESIVANPIIYRLVPRPSRFEIRQFEFESTARTPLANFPSIIFPSRLVASFERTLFLWPENRFLALENGRQTLVACPSSVFCVCSTRFFPRQVYAGNINVG